MRSFGQSRLPIGDDDAPRGVVDLTSPEGGPTLSVVGVVDRRDAWVSAHGVGERLVVRVNVAMPDGSARVSLLGVRIDAALGAWLDDAHVGPGCSVAILRIPGERDSARPPGPSSLPPAIGPARRPPDTSTT